MKSVMLVSVALAFVASRVSASPADFAAAPFPLSDVKLTGDWADKQQRNQEVLLSLDMSQWACHFTTTANLTSCTTKDNCIAPGGSGRPQCTPLPGEMGLGGYYGHYQGHWLSATAFLLNSTQDATLQAVSAAAVDTLASVMAAWKAKYGVDGYLFPYDPLVFDKLMKGNGAGPYYSVPFYTLHKLMAGLLDQWDYAGNKQAYTMVLKMGEWVHDRVEAAIADGGIKLWQQVLGCEWGGMNDVLFNLYAHTGNEIYLTTARRFDAWVFTAPLAAGQDTLGSLPFAHANFHLPEIVGNARAYEITGNSTDKTVVDNFFSVLTANHSYATGGSNSGECWQQPRDLGNFLSSQTQESCTQYNVLKVARHKFLVSTSAETADFYERAILNGIIGNQNREGDGATSYIYMLPLGGKNGGVNKKPWGKSDNGFPCCWGTLSESFAKLGDSIFFSTPGGSHDTLYVNQFVSATVTWGPVVLEQVAQFPSHPTNTTALTVHIADGDHTHTFALMLRVPGWATSKNAITINGELVTQKLVPGSYAILKREWSDGDVVEASFPLSLWTDPLNDYHPEHNATLAFMYGPLVLAGIHIDSDLFVPSGTTFKTDPSSFITRNSSTALDFEAISADGTKMQMMPLTDVMDEQYAVYFMTAGTKPPQPKVYYCPKSANQTAAVQPVDVEPAFISQSLEEVEHLITSRGVHWGRVGDRVAAFSTNP